MKRILAAVSLSALLLTGCSSPSPTASQTPTPKQYVTAPLTGIKYEVGSADAQGLSRASVACKIDNSEAARPQIGLNSTDLVFDEMVEGGLTRFVAIWQSHLPEAVGPVRSIRPMDPDILTPFGGIVCYSGGQAVFVNMMRSTPLFNASETTEQGKGTFTRVHDREAPHNVVVNALKLSTDHPESAAPTAQFNFAQDFAHATATATGQQLTDLTVTFPAASAKWTATSAEQLTRTQDGKPHTDAADGSNIHASNVVVMQVTVDRSYADPKYSYVPKDVVIGTGKAWVVSGDHVVEAIWSKTSRQTSITLALADGTPVQLAPGNTWVELQPVDVGKTVVNLAPTPSPHPSK
jgi:hypothetical protein